MCAHVCRRGAVCGGGIAVRLHEGDGLPGRGGTEVRAGGTRLEPLLGRGEREPRHQGRRHVSRRLLHGREADAAEGLSDDADRPRGRGRPHRADANPDAGRRLPPDGAGRGAPRRPRQPVPRLVRAARHARLRRGERPQPRPGAGAVGTGPRHGRSQRLQPECQRAAGDGRKMRSGDADREQRHERHPRREALPARRTRDAARLVRLVRRRAAA